MATLRLLNPSDEPALEAFLSRHADSSMFLRSNARTAGLEDCGAPLQATYVAAFEDGRITAVAAHCWNGNLLVQAPAHVQDCVREAVARSGRRVGGLIGPWEQVAAARRALGLEHAPTAVAGRDQLFSLRLADLIVPEALGAGRVICRRTATAELDLMVEWRVAFNVEALGQTDGVDLQARSREDVIRTHQDGSSWVLFDGATPVSYSAFNSRLPEVVQIGGVWTPPALRGLGYARGVVAGSLMDARREGVRRAVLFAQDTGAKRAYLAIGFRVVGEYGLILFRDPL
ncbi:MAG: GNAT family N-acetyltransferase [Gemmatimonadales bacterium]